METVVTSERKKKLYKEHVTDLIIRNRSEARPTGMFVGS